MPVSLSHNYVYRSSLGLTYASQVVTRLVLTLHYIRTFDRLIDYGRDVERGTFIRYMHANGASLFLLLMFLHVARRMYYNSSNKKSRWISGIVILLLSMRVAFLGYVLPYGQMSYWGATVIINLLSIVSDTLVVWLWGGYVVSKFTLTRFYTLHFLLPLAMAVLLLRHLHLLHGTRGSSLSYAPVKLSFFPFFALKDAMVWLVALTAYLFISCVYPNLLGDAENFIPANPLVTPVHIKPEWYFLFAYAILRCIPTKTLGVLALAAAVAVPVVLAVGQSSTTTVSFALLALTFSLLTVVGRMAIVKHYFLMSQCLSLMYFFLVTVLS